ncbi:succinate dehydrogenase cytochrome b subunit [Kineosporia sp. NBRC 101731]|uniref:succinate dehydrogenase cytochrome b subunit n=1 Tax=Kineosporia sp. NBRC 101731 TaxID=3032199 RepID=UPI002555A0F2|nr:succinate dehydrogenase cytochrome b subunit [Kineosporia sp. NBRC 101731]
MVETLSKNPRVTGFATLHRSTIGRKMIMAVTGLIMLAFVVVHMVGNLKIFFGETEFNEYAAWLRTIGEPALHEAWYLWIQRAVLTVALVLHIWAAVTLSRHDVNARPVKYHAKRKGGYATSTMRWGGVTLLLFIIWHILDMTTGTVNPATSHEPYERITAGFDQWWNVGIYTLAMVALCLHIWHGLWSAANTLGWNRATTAGFRTFAVVVALVIGFGFLLVPYSVVFGLVD